MRLGARVLVVYKSDPAFSPSVIATCYRLRSAGCDVVLLCVDPSTAVARALQSAGIAVHTLPGETEIKANPIVRAARWLQFANLAWRYLDTLLTPSTVLWVASVETAAALGNRLFSRRYVLHMHELYDREWRYRIFLRRLVRRAAIVIVPEDNRAALVRLWYQPAANPIVIPNKPFYSRDQLAHVALHQAGIDEHLADILTGPKKILLYQGLIDLSERDLLPLAKISHRLRDEWQLVLMGHDLGSMAKIRRECPSAVHVPFIAPPYHLKVTELAYAGVVTYRWNTLNTIYCAPNKTWEYALCSKPMLCNDVPGLTTTVGRYKAGICIDFRDQEGLSSALSTIDAEYSGFVRGCADLYASVDAEHAFRQVVSQFLEVCAPTAGTAPYARACS